MKFLKLLPILRRYRRGFFLGFASLAVVNILQLSVPMLTARAVDAIGRPESAVPVTLLCLSIMLAGTLMVFFRYQWRVHIFRSARLVEKEMRDTFFAHLLRLPQSFYDKTRTGEILALAMNDIGAIRMFVGVGILAFIDAIVMITMCLTIMMYMHFKLTLWIALPLPLVSLCAWFVGKYLHRGHERVQSLFGNLSAQVTEDVKGIRVIKAFVREEARRNRFHALCDTCFHANMWIASLQGFFTPFMRFIGGLALCILLFRGGIEVISGRVSFATFVAFTGYVGLLSWPMMAVGWVLNLYERARASLERVMKVLESPEIRRVPHGYKDIRNHHTDIEIKNLTFRYSESSEDALRNVSFTARQGKIVALVGPVGSGKSTLLHLLLRIYEPPAGTLFLSGQDVCQWDLAALRDAVSFVPQDDFVFSTTLKQNLAFGRPGVTDAEVKQLIHRVGMRHEVESFDFGMEALIGERGVTLSGGQRQRLCVARALAKNAPLLVLDDAFSSVDVATEKAILDTIFEKRSSRTAILVSQRIETVRRADRIVVLEEGRVADEGDHDALIRSNALYRSLFERQLLHEGLKNRARTQ